MTGAVGVNTGPLIKKKLGVLFFAIQPTLGGLGTAPSPPRAPLGLSTATGVLGATLSMHPWAAAAAARAHASGQSEALAENFLKICAHDI